MYTYIYIYIYIYIIYICIYIYIYIYIYHITILLNDTRKKYLRLIAPEILLNGLFIRTDNKLQLN